MMYLYIDVSIELNIWDILKFIYIVYVINFRLKLQIDKLKVKFFIRFYIKVIYNFIGCI